MKNPYFVIKPVNSFIQQKLCHQTKLALAYYPSLEHGRFENI